MSHPLGPTLSTPSLVTGHWTIGHFEASGFWNEFASRFIELTTFV